MRNSSHINKREDTVCEATEKPPSLQLPAEIAGFEDSRNLLKIHRPLPNGVFRRAAGRTTGERVNWQAGREKDSSGELPRRDHEFAYLRLFYSSSWRIVLRDRERLCGVPHGG